MPRELPAPRSLVDRVRPVCLAAGATLLAARPLWPSDSATVSGVGLPAALGWLVLLAVWIAAGLRDGKLEIRCRPLDFALIALAACIAISGAWAVSHAAPRPAINVAWEWLALLASFWLIRQWIRDSKEARALLVVMIGVSVAEAAYALEQYFITLPADRAAFAADPDGMLRRNGLWFEPGSRQRYLFEQRLASTEPFGTFELANSLGGFLATWLVVVTAIGAVIVFRQRNRDRLDDPSLGRERTDRVDWLSFAAIVVAAIPLAATLTLTKSRSAVLALAAGLVSTVAAVLGTQALGSRRARLGVLAGGAVVMLLAVGFGAASGAFDWEVLSEAPKSLGYRWEYWQATMPIIGEHPLLGCGPGNFRDAYPVHRLPQASEEIADPHNFLLEVTASAGMPSGLALVVLLTAAVVACFRATATDSSATVNSADESSTSYWPVLAGLPAGFVLAFMLPVIAGPLIAVPLGGMRMLTGLAFAGVSVALLMRWVRRGPVAAWVPAAGSIALLVNFLAAGGIGFPATAGSLWLLLAVGLSLVDRGRCPAVIGRRVLLPAGGAACVVAVSCFATAYRPVVAAAERMAEASIATDPRESEAGFVAATSADPLDAQPWARLASIRFSQWMQHPEAGSWKQFESAARDMLLRRPDHSAAWSFVGDCYLGASQRTGDAAHRGEAIRAYRRAVELYPNQALRHAKLSIALAESGDAAAAQVEARQAVRLDDITPHIDQKLSDDLKRTMQRLATPTRPPQANRFHRRLGVS